MAGQREEVFFETEGDVEKGVKEDEAYPPHVDCTEARYDVNKGLDELQGLNGDIKVAIEALNAAVELHNEKRAEAEKLLGEINKSKKKQRIKCVRTSCCSFNPHPPVLVPVHAILVRRC